MSNVGLRAVKAASGRRAPVKRVRQSVAAAAASGDHHGLLVAVRARVAETVSDPKCPPSALAMLTLRLLDIAREIKAIDERAAKERADSVSSGSEPWSPASL